MLLLIYVTVQTVIL